MRPSHNFLAIVSVVLLGLCLVVPLFFILGRALFVGTRYRLLELVATFMVAGTSSALTMSLVPLGRGSEQAGKFVGWVICSLFFSFTLAILGLILGLEVIRAKKVEGPGARIVWIGCFWTLLFGVPLTIYLLKLIF